MKGIEFKIIRLANKISAKKIGKELGYISKTPVLNAEKLKDIPDKYIEVLKKLTGLEFTNSWEINRIVRESALSIKKLDPRNTAWKSIYSFELEINTDDYL